MLLAAGLASGLASVMAGVSLGASVARAQSSQQQAPAQGGNPFPQDPQKTPPDSPAKQPGGNGNAFPGEDPNVPIVPVGPDPDTGAASNPGQPAGDSGSSSNAGANAAAGRDADPDGDPVRSPDQPSGGPDSGADGFSSSRNGVNQAPAEDDSNGAPGKSTKNKSRDQIIHEDLDIGRFYLDRKNWRGAQGRFGDAFALDREEPEAVWGLAEAERHLNLNAAAETHYKLLLSYDPNGPHSRAAVKALDELETKQAVPPTLEKSAPQGPAPPK